MKIASCFPGHVLVPNCYFTALTEILNINTWFAWTSAGMNAPSWNLSIQMSWYLSFAYYTNLYRPWENDDDTLDFWLYVHAFVAAAVPTCFFWWGYWINNHVVSGYFLGRAWPPFRIPLFLCAMIMGIKRLKKGALTDEEAKNAAWWCDLYGGIIWGWCVVTLISSFVIPRILTGSGLIMPYLSSPPTAKVAPYGQGIRVWMVMGRCIMENWLSPVMILWIDTLTKSRESYSYRFFTYWLLEKVGDWSYVLYICHWPFFLWCMYLFHTPRTPLPMSDLYFASLFGIMGDHPTYGYLFSVKPWYILLYWPPCLAFSAFVYTYYELPIRTWYQNYSKHYEAVQKNIQEIDIVGVFDADSGEMVALLDEEVQTIIW